ncbi:MAG: hypothetical protein ACRC6V_03550 [Bacteroidales bacterium]
MLNYQMSSFFKTLPNDVLPGTAFTQEGTCIALVRDSGKLVARPSTGEAGEVFGGISISVNVPATHGTIVDEFIVPVGGVVELARVPTVGQLLVVVDGVKLTIEVGTDAPLDATSVTLDGTSLIFNEALALKSGRTQYHYELTASEAAANTGDYYGGNNNTAAVVMGVVSGVIAGQICTDMFDASDDWSNVIHPRMGANGKLAATGNGTLLTNLVVQSGPDSGTPMLTVVLR